MKRASSILVLVAVAVVLVLTPLAWAGDVQGKIKSAEAGRERQGELRREGRPEGRDVVHGDAGALGASRVAEEPPPPPGRCPVHENPPRPPPFPVDATRRAD